MKYGAVLVILTLCVASVFVTAYDLGNKATVMTLNGILTDNTTNPAKTATDEATKLGEKASLLYLALKAIADCQAAVQNASTAHATAVSASYTDKPAEAAGNKYSVAIHNLIEGAYRACLNMSEVVANSKSVLAAAPCSSATDAAGYKTFKDAYDKLTASDGVRTSATSAAKDIYTKDADLTAFFATAAAADVGGLSPLLKSSPAATPGTPLEEVSSKLDAAELATTNYAATAIKRQHDLDSCAPKDTGAPGQTTAASVDSGNSTGGITSVTTKKPGDPLDGPGTKAPGKSAAPHSVIMTSQLQLLPVLIFFFYRSILPALTPSSEGM